MKALFLTVLNTLFFSPYAHAEWAPYINCGYENLVVDRDIGPETDSGQYQEIYQMVIRNPDAVLALNNALYARAPEHLRQETLINSKNEIVLGDLNISSDRGATRYCSQSLNTSSSALGEPVYRITGELNSWGQFTVRLLASGNSGATEVTNWVFYNCHQP